MCGRFCLDTRAEVLEATLSLSRLTELRPRYNITPSQPILAVMAVKEERVARWLRWSLIPAWSKDAKIGYHTINTRAETAATKPAFRAAFRCRRCLIPASGNFEWKAEASGKQPYAIRPEEDEQLLVFAGLYEHWADPLDEAIDSCLILVTDAVPAIAEIHDRMPQCLAPVLFDTWLDPAIQDSAPLQTLIFTTPPPALSAQPVTRCQRQLELS